jgi:hypothetical protein
MRRLFIAAALCAAFLALAGTAAASPALRAPGHGLATHGPAGARGAAPALPAPADYTPLGKRLGEITLTVHLTKYDGSVGAGIDVMWQVDDGATTYGGRGTTDAAGDVTFTDAVAAAANGELYAWFGHTDADSSIQGWGDLTWGDGSTIALQPAHVEAGAVRGGPWADDEMSSFGLSLMGDNRFSGGWVSATAVTPLDPLVGTVDAADGQYSRGSLNFFSDEGVEFAFGSPLTLVGGMVTDIGTLSEVDAQRTTVTSPYWASGAPGSTIRVAAGQFPAGWENTFSGQSEYPDTAPTKSFGTRTASGAETQFYSLKVPTTATPGYWYNIYARHTNGLKALQLSTPFQVCTMKPSKASVARGGKIRVTGVVPVYEHWGSELGTAKTVTLWAHKGKAGVPTVKKATRQGWVKVGSVKTTRTGAYKTPYFRALKTLTLVVWYPGDPWWWEAYTSAKTVRVR